MKKKIYLGRYTALTDEPFVVFLVGMRINQLWALHRWLPVFLAMTRMLIELHKNPHKGMLNAQTRFSWREFMVQSYWHSYEELEDYARTMKNEHLPAWKKFNQTIGAQGSVGIWHETFLIAPKQYECVYVNMPVSGLAKAKNTDFVKATGTQETSWSRLGGHNKPAVKSPETPE